MTAKTGIETEESLISESAARETSLNSQIIDLENELKQSRHELERVTAERDRMLQENSDIGKDKEDRHLECKRLRAELREIKFRETRLIADYSELEEENIVLQKQISGLRSSQVREAAGGRSERFKVLCSTGGLRESQARGAAAAGGGRAAQLAGGGAVEPEEDHREAHGGGARVAADGARGQVRAEEGAGPARQPRIAVQHKQSRV